MFNLFNCFLSFNTVETFNSFDQPLNSIYLPSYSLSSSVDHLPISESTLARFILSQSPLPPPPPPLPKRYSEFLGGPGKRVSEFLGGPGKRNPTYGYSSSDLLDKRLRATTTGYYLAKKLSEILSRNSNGPVVGPYRPGGSEFLGGPGK